MSKSDARSTQPFGALVVGGHARLTVVSGKMPAGLTYGLSGDSHTAGREADGVAMPADVEASPRHAVFSYQDGKLFVADNDSTNGVYLRIRAPHKLSEGDWFRVGNQYFRFTLLQGKEKYPTDDGTLVFTSPARKGSFSVQQVFAGGKMGLSSTASNDEITIGADGTSIVFTADQHLSGSHAKVYKGGGGYLLEDLGSTNGTYVRLGGRTALEDGDLIFIGSTLLRVDIT